MASLSELPTSEVIDLAKSYLSGWSGLPLSDDIANEVLNRLDYALAAVRQAIKERDDLQRKLEASQLAVRLPGERYDSDGKVSSDYDRGWNSCRASMIGNAMAASAPNPPATENQ